MIIQSSPNWLRLVVHLYCVVWVSVVQDGYQWAKLCVKDTHFIFGTRIFILGCRSEVPSYALHAHFEGEKKKIQICNDCNGVKLHAEQ